MEVTIEICSTLTANGTDGELMEQVLPILIFHHVRRSFLSVLPFPNSLYTENLLEYTFGKSVRNTLG